MRVDHARPAEANRLRHFLRMQPSAQQSKRGPAGTQSGRVALQELRGLAEVLSDEPHQVLHHPLLPTSCAIAVVQEQDHAGRTAY
jgi:hypothetical protein